MCVCVVAVYAHIPVATMPLSSNSGPSFSMHATDLSVKQVCVFCGSVDARQPALQISDHVLNRVTHVALKSRNIHCHRVQAARGKLHLLGS